MITEFEQKLILTITPTIGPRLVTLIPILFRKKSGVGRADVRAKTKIDNAVGNGNSGNQRRAGTLARAFLAQSARKTFISALSVFIRGATPLYFFVVPFTVCYGRASRIRLNGVSVARRNRVNPPCVTTSRKRDSPAWAPRPSPTS